MSPVGHSCFQLSPSLALVSILTANSLGWKQSGFPRLPISVAIITHLAGVQATMWPHVDSPEVVTFCVTPAQAP